MYKYLIWDFNGTILDDLELCLHLLNVMLEKQNKPKLDVPAYKHVFGFPIRFFCWLSVTRAKHGRLSTFAAKFPRQSAAPAARAGCLARKPQRR